VIEECSYHANIVSVEQNLRQFVVAFGGITKPHINTKSCENAFSAFIHLRDIFQDHVCIWVSQARITL
jgi:hypothetical protein